jgi:hypothetical protein
MLSVVRDEEEGLGQGGGKTGDAARGGQDGRRTGLLALPGGGVANCSRHPQMLLPLHQVHQASTFSAMAFIYLFLGLPTYKYSQGGLTSGRRLVVKIIAESLS